MEKTYDFRIDSATMEAALEKYRELESVLEEELEALQTGIPEGSLEWAGAGQEALVEGMHTFLSEGGYAITYDLVSKLCECLEEALLQIYSLQSRCEGFVDQFSADEYTEPETPIEGKSYNGGILSINYNEGSQIGDLCDSISEEGNLFRNEVYEILSGCSDLLGEMSEDMERLDAAR
ncbi:MAG: hypothetical protein E7284_08620, partial [Lachnospiraceae bacterium]|nr:hypothetical protein [Lachnospiraceae bacterium]